MPSLGTSRPLRVVIAGGGFAGVEAMIALHTLAGDRVDQLLIAPRAELLYRPAAPYDTFAGGDQVHRYDLCAITAGVGAHFREDRVEAVASRQNRVRMSSSYLDYDALVLAIGARAEASIPGALTFRDQRDAPKMRAVLAAIERREVSRVAFAVPSGCTWPLPLYELALLTAAHIEDRGLVADLLIVSPEHVPLESFGAEASAAVARLLAEHGVYFEGGSVPHAVERGGSLALSFGPPVRCDRVVALPQLRGRPPSGVPGDWWGFVQVDGRGRVEGTNDVYAAGDMTSFAIKQGGLATQQADVIAQALAARCGALVEEPPLGRVLQARLLAGEKTLVLRTELDSEGQPTPATLQHLDPREAELSTEKVSGRYLTPYLQSHPEQLAA
jgi:sulfide:quinone oxidoreductase